jgi:eukaryotic-like serine/threonine-protein kinase
MMHLGPSPSTAFSQAIRAPAPAQRPLCGDWELVDLAAMGQFSLVYRARPAGAAPEQKPAYAVKLLQPRWAANAQAIAALRREASLGLSLRSPHVVSVLSASVNSAPYYVVTPWLNGRTLLANLARWPWIPVHRALWIARQVATGLAAIHQRGWVHGDVKPDNILIAPEGHVTLLDLGFARRPGENAKHRECLLGTARYMAPETVSAHLPTDARSDLYSLGVVLYEMLAGRAPFAGDTAAQFIEQHKRYTPPRLELFAPHVPADVANLVHRLLAKEPLRRPHSAAELLERLATLEIEALCNWTAK